MAGGFAGEFYKAVKEELMPVLRGFSLNLESSDGSQTTL